jgi:thiol-disulfide isomerase/thioredoxin
MRFQLLGLAMALVAGSAHATVAVENYNPSLLNSLQNFGEPVVLIVTRSNCTACDADGAVLQNLASLGRYASIRIMKIDADKNSSAVRALGIGEDTRAIGFHGFKETRRASGTADAAKLEDVFTSTLR